MSLIKVSHVVKFLWQHDPPNEEVLSTCLFNYATLCYIMLRHAGTLEPSTNQKLPCCRIFVKISFHQVKSKSHVNFCYNGLLHTTVSYFTLSNSCRNTIHQMRNFNQHTRSAVSIMLHIHYVKLVPWSCTRMDLNQKLPSCRILVKISFHQVKFFNSLCYFMLHNVANGNF